MSKKNKLISSIFYIIYAGFWLAIGKFIISDIYHGIKVFTANYGILGILISLIIIIAALISPIFLHKFIKASWKIPVISTGIALLVWAIWFVLMGIAVTAT